MQNTESDPVGPETCLWEYKINICKVSDPAESDSLRYQTLPNQIHEAQTQVICFRLVGDVMNQIPRVWKLLTKNK
jgi:hypothetical protein